MKKWAWGVSALGMFTMACHHAPPATTSTPAPSRAVRAEAVTDGRTLISAMRERYAGEWYKTISFTQRTTTTMRTGGELAQTWFEGADIPGRLHIDTSVPPNGNGVLYANDSLYVFSEGRLTRSDTGINPLLVLGFDVYGESPARTEATLRHLHFDLTRLHETTWLGRPVYVVGALAGDTTTNQFWVDRDRLLFVRMIQHSPRGRADVRFNKYERAGGGWIAVEVEELIDGKRVLLEQYSDVKVNPALPAGFFDPRQWRAK
jgi:hypothetical protein